MSWNYLLIISDVLVHVLVKVPIMCIGLTSITVCTQLYRILWLYHLNTIMCIGFPGITVYTHLYRILWLYHLNTIMCIGFPGITVYTQLYMIVFRCIGFPGIIICTSGDWGECRSLFIRLSKNSFKFSLDFFFKKAFDTGNWDIKYIKGTLKIIKTISFVYWDRKMTILPLFYPSSSSFSCVCCCDVFLIYVIYVSSLIWLYQN